jgi:phi13 family phage major tail protein
MKKVGLKHPVYARYSDATGSPVYTNGAVIAKAMSASIAINKNNTILYADDDIDEIDQSFISGTETLGINELPLEVQSVLLGHAIVNGEMTANSNDISPYIGHGFYGKIKRNNVNKWRAIWFKKMQFGEPNDETETQGESVVFQTPSIEGTIMKDINGDWKDEKVFDTEAEAIAWLDGKAGITPICKTPVASIAAGSYAVAQSVELTAGEGEAIYYTTNGTTPSATNGTLYSVAINIAATTMLRAIATKAGSSNSEIASYEYIITA